MADLNVNTSQNLTLSENNGNTQNQPFDNHKNFAYSLVATAPSPATSGTSLVVTAGQGSLFPTAPFNAVVWPSGLNPISTNAEIVRVTNVSTDTLTITRSQEGSANRSIIVGDQISNNITLKWFSDIESAIELLPIKVSGSLVGGSLYENISHNLNSRNVVVSVRNNVAPFDQVSVTVEVMSVNQITIRGSQALPAGYVWTVIG